MSDRKTVVKTDLNQKAEMESDINGSIINER